jgi:methylenetetrahydrofolate reductase (NADPH)
MNDLQLEMNFSRETSRNRLRDTINRGEFVLLVECNSPGRDIDPAAAVEKLAVMEKAALESTELPVSLAITDGYRSLKSYRAVECAAALSPENRDRHLVYLSGRDVDAAELKNLSSLALDAGIRNLIAVSGDAARGESVKETRKRAFTESIEMLNVWQNRNHPALQIGAATNPFQYTAYTLIPQYNKMLRKIHSGAQVIVTQAGWDMLKLQTLRWYLTLRDLYIPTVARLVLLTPERVEKILAGFYPGITISPDFRKILDKELRFSLAQFEAAQWRRLELQAAGCRLLGYSGIQLSGIDHPAKLKIAVERIAAALKEFTEFDHWLEEYNSYLAMTEMAPFCGSFHLFDRVLHRAYPEKPPRLNEPEPPAVSGAEKLRLALRSFFFPHADRQPPENRRLLKAILCGCRSCAECRLPQCMFTCPEHCPKRLANGSCGGMKPNGMCELSTAECVHRRITRLAHYRGEGGNLEDLILHSGRK